MIIAVTGSRGLIGAALTQYLESLGHTVRRLDRTDSWDGATYDLSSADTQWWRGVEGADVAVNAAGMAHDTRTLSAQQVRTYQAVNAEGVGRWAHAAVEAGVRRLIHLSTVKVLGERPMSGDRFNETDALAPVGPYAQTKADGERQMLESLRNTNSAATILRLPLVFGTPFKGNLATLASAITKGIPLPLGHPEIGRRTYVMMPDLLDLVSRIAESEADLPPVLHARSAPDLTAGEVACLVGDELGRRPRLVRVPPPLLRNAARLLGSPEAASKICDPMLMGDDITRAALGLPAH